MRLSCVFGAQMFADFYLIILLLRACVWCISRADDADLISLLFLLSFMRDVPMRRLYKRTISSRADLVNS